MCCDKNFFLDVKLSIFLSYSKKSTMKEENCTIILMSHVTLILKYINTKGKII